MKYPMAPLVLGIILGTMLDTNLRRSLMLGNGDLTPFFTRPISAALALLIIGSVGWKLLSMRRRRITT
jgi:putative tricarboxylic transport membrane protein